MVVISEIPGGSNCGGPNKNPRKEEENQNENSQEEEEDQNENLQQVEENQKENLQEENQNESPQQVEENQNENLQKVEENQNENPQEENQNESPQQVEENPNENLQQVEENQNENPQEENQNENPQRVEENLSILEQLPSELTEIILARFPRCKYGELSLVSKALRQVIRSQNLFQTRSLLGFTEPVLYALIGFPPIMPPTWFFLSRSNLPLQLIRISSLPPMFPGSAVVTFRHKMYVMGGYIGLYQPVRSVFVIDCRFHTWGHLSDMKRARNYAAAGVIGGKIYVIGGRKKRDKDWVEVFDIEQERWETVPTQCPNDASESGVFNAYVVMQEKIFILDRQSCLAYEPRQGIWQSWGVASQLKRFWLPSSCVVEDLLYCLDLTGSYGHPLVVYYPNELVWRPVMGVDNLLMPVLRYDLSTMANFGGKLVILGYFNWWVNDIWCIEIALETRQGGEIWGNVESTSRVFRISNCLSIECCRTVTV